MKNGLVCKIEEKILFQFGPGYIASYMNDHGFKDSIILDCHGIHAPKSGFNLKREL